jgi:O-antigen ligase
MQGATVRQSAASLVDRFGVLPLLALIALGAASAVLGPEILASLVIGIVGALIIARRPPIGVAIILLLLMVQYGSRRYEREGLAYFIGLLPQGSGLLTVNNLLGVFLALLLAYHLYRDSDWSFLKSRQLQLVLLITGVLLFSAFISGIDEADQASVGLRATTAQHPARLLVSRALLLVLFVFFVRAPRDLRLIVGLFVILAVATAWSGSGAAITGAGRAEVSTYRAGGLEVLFEGAQNPNRLALVCTLALVFIWEYSQAHHLRRWRWLAIAAVMLLVITVFLSASRGGLIGMAITGMMLFVRRRGGSGRMLYGVAAFAIGAMLVQEVVPEQALERITNIPGISRSDSGGVGEGSVQRRAYTYEVGLDIWKQAPLVGIGPGNWSYVRFVTDPLRSAAAAHNSYLAALAEGGAITLILYLVLFYVTIRDLLRLERTPAIVAQAKADGLEWLLAATRVCLIAFLVFSLFADLWDLVFSYFLFALAAVMIQRYAPVPATAEAYRSPRRAAAVPA